MTSRTTLSRRGFTATALASLLSPHAVGAEMRLRPILPHDPQPKRSARQLVEAAKLSGTHSFCVIDLDSGIFHDLMVPDEALPPASVTKVLTAQYALSHLAPNHHFATELLSNGSVQNGTLRGDLILRGHGDPSFCTEEVDSLVRQLRDQGIKEVSGKFMIDVSTFPALASIDPSQPPFVSYNPAISALNINDNRVHFRWKRQGAGYSIKFLSMSDKASHPVTFIHEELVGPQMPLFSYRQSDIGETWLVRKNALGRSGARWLPTRRPADITAEIFRAQAVRQGITIGPALPLENSAPLNRLAVSHSDPLTEQLRWMLKVSDNLHAECLGITASQAQSLPHDTLEASAQAMANALKNTYGLSSAQFVDHSGLSDQNRISAREMAVFLANTPELSHFLNPISYAQKREPLPPGLTASGKTGTLDFVSSLTGYIYQESRPKLAYAIFMTDLEKRARSRAERSERPKGSQTWLRTARSLQKSLLLQWAGDIWL